MTVRGSGDRIRDALESFAYRDHWREWEGGDSAGWDFYDPHEVRDGWEVATAALAELDAILNERDALAMKFENANGSRLYWQHRAERGEWILDRARAALAAAGEQPDTTLTDESDVCECGHWSRHHTVGKHGGCGHCTCAGFAPSTVRLPPPAEERDEQQRTVDACNIELLCKLETAEAEARTLREALRACEAYLAKLDEVRGLDDETMDWVGKEARQDVADCESVMRAALAASRTEPDEQSFLGNDCGAVVRSQTNKEE